MIKASAYVVFAEEEWPNLPGVAVLKVKCRCCGSFETFPSCLTTITMPFEIVPFGHLLALYRTSSHHVTTVR